MKEAGWGLVVLGLCALFGAFLFVDVTRDIGYIPYASDYLPRMPQSVANVHAMHIQSLVFHAGLFSFLAGVILIATATIDEAIRRRDPRPENVVPSAEPASYTAEPAGTSTEATDLDSQPEAPAGGWVVVALAAVAVSALIAVVAVNNAGTDASFDRAPATANISNATEAAIRDLENAAAEVNATANLLDEAAGAAR